MKSSYIILLALQFITVYLQVYLEIQQGEGPHSVTVDHPVKIGDNLTLVVRARSTNKGEQSTHSQRNILASSEAHLLLTTFC